MFVNNMNGDICSLNKEDYYNRLVAHIGCQIHDTVLNWANYDDLLKFYINSFLSLFEKGKVELLEGYSIESVKELVKDDFYEDANLYSTKEEFIKLLLNHIENIKQLHYLIYPAEYLKDEDGVQREINALIDFIRNDKYTGDFSEELTTILRGIFLKEKIVNSIPIYYLDILNPTKKRAELEYFCEDIGIHGINTHTFVYEIHGKYIFCGCTNVNETDTLELFFRNKKTNLIEKACKDTDDSNLFINNVSNLIRIRKYEEALRTLEVSNIHTAEINERKVETSYLIEEELYRNIFSKTKREVQKYYSDINFVKEIPSSILYINGIIYYSIKEYRKAIMYFEEYLNRGLDPDYSEDTKSSFLPPGLNNPRPNFLYNIDILFNLEDSGYDICFAYILESYLKLAQYQKAYDIIKKHYGTLFRYGTLWEGIKEEEIIDKLTKDIITDLSLIVFDIYDGKIEAISKSQLFKTHPMIKSSIDVFNNILNILIIMEDYENALILLKIMKNCRLFNENTIVNKNILDSKMEVLELKEENAIFKKDREELDKIKQKSQEIGKIKYAIRELLGINDLISNQEKKEKEDEDFKKQTANLLTDIKEDTSYTREYSQNIIDILKKQEDKIDNLILINTEINSRVESSSRFQLSMSRDFYRMLKELAEKDELIMENNQIIIQNLDKLDFILLENLDKYRLDVLNSIEKLSIQYRINTNSIKWNIEKEFSRVKSNVSDLSKQIVENTRINRKGIESIKLSEDNILNELTKGVNDIMESIFMLEERLELIISLNNSIEDIKLGLGSINVQLYDIDDNIQKNLNANYIEIVEEIKTSQERLIEKQDKANIDSIENSLKNNLGNKAWNLLSENDKSFLLTSRLIYQDLIHVYDVDKIDFSAVCIGLTKTLESFLTKQFIYKIKAYCNKNNYRKFDYILKYKGKDRDMKDTTLFEIIKAFPKVNIVGNSGEKNINKEKYVFFNNSYSYIVDNYDFKIANMNDYIDKRDVYKSIFSEELFDDKDFFQDEFLSFSKEMVLGLNYVRLNHRNKAAHKGALTKEYADECYDILVITEKLIKIFAENLNKI
ncbi:MAG: hypothetical protein GX968_05240 [Tissierellia bacterium]|nr:hypothetical protein [Tissierellia bacterium]